MNTPKNAYPFFRKGLSHFPQRAIPFFKKGCAFFSPPPEWLERVAVWVMQVPRKCHGKMSDIAQSINDFRCSSCQVSRLIIVFCNTNSIIY